ncbi:MAG: 2Fe-2S iron-sulfur cluster-binding protein [Chloroflexota bacterium]|nr:MAG: ferredoxin [Chloroflexota bacterium]
MILQYQGRDIAARRNDTLLDVILGAGAEHRHVCGGHGFCTSCRVEVLQGGGNLSPVSDLERERLCSQAGRLRLACQTRLLGDVEVRVPPPVFSGFGPDDL